MRKFPLAVNLIIAMVAVVIIGSTIDVIDQTFGTHLSSATGLWLAVIAAFLLAWYMVLAFKSRKK
ncbi:MAG: hypothetical protein P4N41_16860 [Negativicutes bacterium]|nr:hypothetical protein [Negativicutes bacterium]